MNDLDVADGYYVLREDVKNPCPDRRKKAHVIPQPIWPKGLRIHVKRYKHLSPRPQFRIFDGSETFDFYEGQVNAILPFLEPAPPTLGQVLNSSYGRIGGGTVLMFLLEKGLLNLEQIEGAVKEYEDIDEKLYEDLQKKHWLD